MAIVAKQPIVSSKTSAASARGADVAAGGPKKKASPKKPTVKRPATRPAPRVASGALPGWGEIGMAPMATRTSRIETLSERLPARRFYLVLLVFLVAVVLYVGHVYATKTLYRALQTARTENLALHLKHNRLRGELDAATAPSVVVARARALGLDEGMAYGPTIPLLPAP